MIPILFMGLAFADNHTQNVKNALYQLRSYPTDVKKSDIKDTLTKFMNASLKDYYSRRKLPRSLNPSNAKMKKVVDKAIRNEVFSILSSRKGGRTDGFIEIITGHWAEKFYSDILGLGISFEAPFVKPRTDEITVVDSKYFTGIPREVTIRDIGLEGGENFVVDAGEFITLTLPIVNKSNSYLYSTSAFVFSSSDYVSTFNLDEIEIKELDPEDSTTVKVKFYLSKNVPNNTTIPINIKLYDSRFFKSTPEVLTYKLKVKNLKSTQLRNVIVDTDMPGSSMKSEKPRVAQGQRFEVRNDVFVQDSNALNTMVEYRTSSLLPFKYRSGFLGKKSVTGGTLFLARDDLDFKMPIGAIYSGLISNSNRYLWIDQDKPVVYLAVDSLVHLSKKTSQKPKATESKQKKLSPKPLSAEEVIELLEEYIALEPLKVPAPADALDAAHGFQIQFDSKAFTQSYKDKLRGESDSKTSSSPQTSSKTPSHGTYYQYRHYIEIPIEKAKPIRKAPKKPAVKKAKPVEIKDPNYRLAIGFSSISGLFQMTLYQDRMIGLAGQLSLGGSNTIAVGGNVAIPLNEGRNITLNIRPMMGTGIGIYDTNTGLFGKIDLGPDVLLNDQAGLWGNLSLSTYDGIGGALGFQLCF